LALDKTFVGKTFPSTTFTIDKERIKRYCESIEEVDPVFKEGEVAPPMFASCFLIPSMMGAMSELSNLIDPTLIARIVHGEQEYEFYRPIKPGTYTLEGRIADITEKMGRSGMLDVMILETIAKNEKGEVSVIGRSTILIRRP